jgi:hypothetical protein
MKQQKTLSVFSLLIQILMSGGELQKILRDAAATEKS